MSSESWISEFIEAAMADVEANNDEEEATWSIPQTLSVMSPQVTPTSPFNPRTGTDAQTSMPPPPPPPQLRNRTPGKLRQPSRILSSPPRPQLASRRDTYEVEATPEPLATNISSSPTNASPRACGINKKTDLRRPKHFTKPEWEGLELRRQRLFSHVGRIDETLEGMKALAACQGCTEKNANCRTQAKAQAAAGPITTHNELLAENENLHKQLEEVTNAWDGAEDRVTELELENEILRKELEEVRNA
ncbi:hypothetical protein LTR37_000772 [Vermiconidia calcicola]|uniref:Uncharacterized protein n=1 Tax=Vermiconidia calcicola TaxID=1690605 RepID=A0ACC3NZQ7_9PEZI|nr:hypothetical protein LTR37_000772 [Vermiconidia calcicola]